MNQNFTLCLQADGSVVILGSKMVRCLHTARRNRCQLKHPAEGIAAQHNASSAGSMSASDTNICDRIRAKVAPGLSIPLGANTARCPFQIHAMSTSTHLVFLMTDRIMIFCRRSYMCPEATVKMWMVSGSSSGLRTSSFE